MAAAIEASPAALPAELLPFAATVSAPFPAPSPSPETLAPPMSARVRRVLPSRHLAFRVRFRSPCSRLAPRAAVLEAIQGARWIRHLTHWFAQTAKARASPLQAYRLISARLSSSAKARNREAVHKGTSPPETKSSFAAMPPHPNACSRRSSVHAQPVFSVSMLKFSWFSFLRTSMISMKRSNAEFLSIRSSTRSSGLSVRINSGSAAAETASPSK